MVKRFPRFLFLSKLQVKSNEFLPCRNVIWLEFDGLLKVDDCICGDIVNELPLSQPTVSQHLKELKMAGLIKGNVEGNSICYCIDGKGIAKLRDYFATISVKLEKKNCC